VISLYRRLFMYIDGPAANVVRPKVISSNSMPIINVDEVRELSAKDRYKDKLQNYPISYQITFVEPSSD
jgi:hypothetical protein